MPIQTDAPAGSSTAQNVFSNPSSVGNQTQKTQEQLLAEYKAENERKQELLNSKQEVIDGLNERLEDVKNEMSELRQLVEAGQATRVEQVRLQNLNNQEGDIEGQIAILENDPKNRLAYMSFDRRIEKAVQKAEALGEHRALYRLQVGLIEDTAEEFGIDSDKFIKELTPIAKRFQYDSDGQPINVYRKAQLAIREWKKIDAQKKADAEAKKKEAEAGSTRETGTSQVREVSILDNRGKLTPQTKEMGDVLKSVGL